MSVGRRLKAAADQMKRPTLMSHEDRQELIWKPFPRIDGGCHHPGARWAGVLIDRELGGASRGRSSASEFASDDLSDYIVED